MTLGRYWLSMGELAARPNIRTRSSTTAHGVSGLRRMRDTPHQVMKQPCVCDRNQQSELCGATEVAEHAVVEKHCAGIGPLCRDSRLDHSARGNGVGSFSPVGTLNAFSVIDTNA